MLKSELDYLRLQLLQTPDGGVSGHLVFDLQEKSIGDYFKAMFNKDQITKPLSLSREQLFLPDGEADLNSIRDVLAGTMMEVIEARL